MTDAVIIRPPAARIRVPRNSARYGTQHTDMDAGELASMLRRELDDAVSEIDTLRHTARVFAAVLEMLVLMNRRGEQPRTVDEDGTLLIPHLPLEVMRERGGSVSVAHHPDGFVVSFRDRGAR